MEQMLQNTSKRPKQKLCLSEQVAFDILHFFNQFPNKNFAKKYLSRETGLNIKTIKRILAKTNKPTYQTLFRLYSVMFAENDYHKLLEICPKIVCDQIVKFSPSKTVTNCEQVDEFLSLVRKDSLMSELYVLAGTGPISRSVVGFRYGQYGIELLDKLLEKKYIYEVRNETYTLSPTAPNLDTESLKHLGEYFVSKFSKPKDAEVSSQNTISFYAEGLNEKGRKAWLAIDTELFYRKLEVANNPEFKGDHKMFTFTATDSINLENKYV
jgi:hypothetical protein